MKRRNLAGLIHGDNMTEHAILPQNIEQIYVYKSVKEGPLEGKLSALVVNRTGDVFGYGVNTIVGCSTYHNEYPMAEGDSQILKTWVKIDSLSGLGIKKIIIGSGFGAATTGNELLTWGRGPVTSLGRNAVVAFQGYQPKLKCKICSKNHCYTERRLGGAALSYCNVAKEIQIIPNAATDGVTVHKFVRFHDDFLYCSTCTKRCSSKEINLIPLYYCTICHLFWDADSNVGSLAMNSGIFSSRIKLQAGITDIAPYGWGIWVLTNNQLFWKGFVRLPTWEECPAMNPNGVRMRSVHWSRAGTFVTTDDGEVHCCTDLVLKKIPLQAAVVKVCCGRNAAVCLLADKSVWSVYENTPPERLLSTGSQAVDLAVLQGYDIFYVQIECDFTSVTVEMKYSGGTLELNMGRSEIKSFLWDMVYSSPIPSSMTSTTHPPTTISQPSVQCQPLVTIPRAQTSKSCELESMKSPSLEQTTASFDSEQLTSFLAGLYGQKQSSDMTIKLSDGDFHAHRCVLMEMSPHFKKTLLNTKAPVVVNMSSANPDAYRCLLKHFYKQKPDDLNIDDSLDLWQLALSHDETALAETTEQKITARINEDNVLHAFGISKLLGCERISEHCKELMKNPTIKEQILNKIIQNPLLLLLLPADNDESRTGSQ